MQIDDVQIRMGLMHPALIYYRKRTATRSITASLIVSNPSLPSVQVGAVTAVRSSLSQGRKHVDAQNAAYHAMRTVPISCRTFVECQWKWHVNSSVIFDPSTSLALPPCSSANSKIDLQALNPLRELVHLANNNSRHHRLLPEHKCRN